MDLKSLEQQVNAFDTLDEWKTLHNQILQEHENENSAEVSEKLLGLHQILLDKVEKSLPDNIEIEKFKAIRQKEYNTMLLREATIGGSLCVETLYEITQRELEAGRMQPTHEFIEIAIQATATEHYSREQLLRQKEKIQNIEERSFFNKLTRLFKNK